MKANIVVFGLIGVIILSLLGYYAYYQSTPGPLDSFAACLEEKGAVFYGAFWCPHCQATKALFGKSASKLPYVECSTPDSQGQLKVCKDKGIQSYPTWIFSDGSILTGERSLQELADKTSCPLPSNA